MKTNRPCSAPKKPTDPNQRTPKDRDESRNIADTEIDMHRLPDVRDGLTREQRVILFTLRQAERERSGKAVPTMMLYGRVASQIPMSKGRFKSLLAQLVGRGSPDA